MTHDHEDRSGGAAFIIGASSWKDFFPVFLPGRTVKRYNTNIKELKFATKILPVLAFSPSAQLFIWSFKEPAFLDRYKKFFRNPVGRIEDGFLRSVRLGRMGAVPLSLCIDSRGIYFDPTAPSDLEHIYNTFDFDADPALEERAQRGIDLLLQSRLSKYNTARATQIDTIYGEKTKKRILVVGQVEGDMSIVKGCTPQKLNLDLVKLAREENPEAQIFYKPHPEVIHRTREGQSDPKLAEPYCDVLYDDIPLADVLDSVDHVYTITSLAGFEALLRGIKVTCLGAPFYSGWGVTDDRQPVARRKRVLTVPQLFAGAYMLYPIYVHPEKQTRISFEEALALLGEMKADHDKQEAEAAKGVMDSQAGAEDPVFRAGGEESAIFPVPVFGINLDREPHRWHRLSHRAKQLGLAVERVPALDRTNCDTEAVSEAFGGKGDNVWAKASIGMMCCALTHQRVWQQILESGAPAGIVLEDDAQLASSFPSYLGKGLAELMKAHDLDVLKLEVNTSRHSLKCRPYGTLLGEVPFDPMARLYRLRSTLICAAAYAITPGAIEKINAAYPKLQVPVDHFLFNQAVGTGFNLLKIGFVTPAPVLHDQLDMESDLYKSRLIDRNLPSATDFARWRKSKLANFHRARVRMAGQKVSRVEIEWQKDGADQR